MAHFQRATEEVNVFRLQYLGANQSSEMRLCDTCLGELISTVRPTTTRRVSRELRDDAILGRKVRELVHESTLR